ncbi:MAG: hypothetical protein U9O89_01425 [Thermoproteota archaeon]|nr:hypothetical protein [Thermoproteota archaeon]
MKIAIMSPWNDCCGVSIHAELIGKEWISQGHEIVVFAPTDERVGGRIPVKSEDERFVYRNWEMYRYGAKVEDESYLDLYFNPNPIINEDYDLFVVEKPCITPLGKLLKIFDVVKRKATTIAVMHEGRVPKNVNFYKFDWDVITLFDERYKKLLADALPADKTYIVPYPCHPIVEGNMLEARSKLGLPQDEDTKIILAYGIRLENLREVLLIFKKLRKIYDVILLMLSSHEESIRVAKDIAREYKFAMFRKEAPPISRLYTYFHASNAILVHKSSANYLPTSSTVHLCLGSTRPVLCPDNNFVEVFDGEVMKYLSLDELGENLIDVFEGRNVQSVLSTARKYVIRNSASNVANALMRLAQSVK